MPNTKPRKPKHFVPIRPKGRGTIPMRDILTAVERLFKAEAESDQKSKPRVGAAS